MMLLDNYFIFVLNNYFKAKTIKTDKASRVFNNTLVSFQINNNFLVGVVVNSETLGLKLRNLITILLFFLKLFLLSIVVVVVVVIVAKNCPTLFFYLLLD
jgi:hypothetical protein